MAAAGLQQAVDRLRIQHPAAQVYAVTAVFDALAKPPAPAPAARVAAIRQCLTTAHQGAVEVAVQRLLQSVRGGGLPPRDAEDYVITALAVAEPGPAAALVQGALSLFLQQALTGGGGPTALGLWRSHPLSRVLLASPAAAQPLVLGVAGLLAAAASAGPAPEAQRRGPPGAAAQLAAQAGFAAVLSALRPFLSYVLLDPALAEAQPHAAPALRAALVRLACGSGAPAAQAALLALLVSHLPAARLATPAQQAAATEAALDILDVIESCEEEPEVAMVAALVQALAGLFWELSVRGALPRPVLRPLERLQGWWPGLAAQHMPQVALLALAGGEGDARGLLRLLAAQLSEAAGSAGGVPAPTRALLAFPLVQVLAFHHSPGLKQWAAHALAASELAEAAAPAGSGGALPSSCSGGQGQAVLVWSCQQLLHELWADDSLAEQWLASLRCSLAPLAGQEGSRDAPQSLKLPGSYATLLAVSALLEHPSPGVQAAAAAALESLVRVEPLAGITLLPLVIRRLQRAVESFLSGMVQALPPVLELLHALTSLAQHAAAVPFVIRALQPLLAPGAPEVLQATALRLLCRLWGGTGRGYAHLRTAVLGYVAPGQEPGLALRVARAECIRDVCSADGGKGAEYVREVQAELADPHPAVQAAALDCIALLCEDDTLDFYPAWRVVHRVAPTLPAHRRPAAAWVRLLAHGFLDAEVHPEVAAGVVDALWLAARHPAAEVRRQAYASLATYDFEVLERIDALRTLGEYAALLHSEAAPANRAACEALVSAALAFEHRQRRRVGRAGGAAGTAGGGSAARAGASSSVGGSVLHRLVSVLPKTLLGGSVALASDLMQRLPDLPVAAVLYFYAPLAPAGKPAAVAARQAAADYEAVFSELMRQPAALPAGEAPAARLLPAWRRFLRRWAAALRAGASAGAADAGLKQQEDASLRQWQVVQAGLADSSPVVAENSVWAAAALCGATAEPAKELLPCVHRALEALAAAPEQGQPPPMAVRCAALRALGALAAVVGRALGLPQLQALVLALEGGLLQGGPPALRGASALGLGAACGQLAGLLGGGGGGEVGAAVPALLEAGLGALLGVAAAFESGAGLPDLRGPAAACGLSLPPADQLAPGGAGDSPALEADVFAGLAEALPPAAEALGLAGVLLALHARLLGQLRGGSAAGAACLLLPAVATEAFRLGALTSADVEASLEQLLAAAAAPGGREAGAAAAALGLLLPAAVGEGHAPGAVTAAAALRRLLELASAAGKLPQAAAAKRGAAAGIAALLGSGEVAMGEPLFKEAVQALEALATKDSDPRSRKACAWPLAALCHRLRHQQQAPEDAPAPGGAAPGAGAAPLVGGKGLAELPADGALRLLVCALQEGRWEEGEEGAPPAALTAEEAGSALRCLASSERLPPLDYSALCRRLLRAHPASGDVQQGCVAFVAAHAAHAQTYRLADVAGDLLSGVKGTAALLPGPRAAALRSLRSLLDTLPQAQAAATLRACCALCPDLGRGSAAAADWSLAAALLKGLHPLASGEGGEALQEVAQDCLLAVLLPRMPQPGTLPVSLAAPPAGGAGLGGARDCWERLLRCATLLPKAKLERALESLPVMAAPHALRLSYAAACLVVRGVADQQALQHPRNLLFQGGGPPEEAALLASFVARGAAALPPQLREQWLAEAIDAAQGCTNQRGALQLAACMVAALARSAGQGLAACADHITSVGAERAVQALPYTLPLLMEGPAWQHGLPALLPALLAAFRAVGPGVVGEGMTKRCLLAVRHQMPPGMWSALSAEACSA